MMYDDILSLISIIVLALAPSLYRSKIDHDAFVFSYDVCRSSYHIASFHDRTTEIEDQHILLLITYPIYHILFKFAPLWSGSSTGTWLFSAAFPSRWPVA